MLDEQTLRKVLNRAGASTQCSACGSDGWSIGSDFVLLQAIKGLDDQFDMNIGQGYLAYQIRCETCGHYAFFSADVIHELAGPETKGYERPAHAEDPPEESS